MSSALAVEARFRMTTFLKSWVDNGQLTYKFSIHENPLQPTRVRATFSKPTPESPATAAVAHLHFHLDNRLQHVLGFTVESETHFHSLQDLRFDEALLDHVIRRKLVLKQQHLISLSDEFSSTRVPSLMKERDDEKRDHNRETLEEYLLERFQRKDPYNDGRISFQECIDVLYALEFPTVSRRERDILFAFIELDRDDMVDYSALTSIGAEVMDTLLNIPGPHATTASAKDSNEANNKNDVVEWVHAVMRHQQFFTMDRLERILDAFRPPPPTPPQPSESKSGEDDIEAKEAGNDTTPEEKESDSSEHKQSESKAQLVPPPHELYITRRQLRTSLESPQLLLSRAEINLTVALAVSAPSGQIPCSQLRELLQHVQTTVFIFQTRCFTDRTEHYLLQQFKTYESSTLKGSAEHLKMRLRQKEIKAVVKDMKKLMLSPLQLSRLVALSEDSPTDVHHIVHYKDCIAKMAEFLAKQVDLSELRSRAIASKELIGADAKLPDEELVHQIAMEKFEQLDENRVGTVPLAAFHESLQELTQSLGVSMLVRTSDIDAITALADPTGQGRVNYVYFQQLIYPLLRSFEYESRLQQHLCGTADADPKNHGDRESKSEK